MADNACNVGNCICDGNGCSCINHKGHKTRRVKTVATQTADEEHELQIALNKIECKLESMSSAMKSLENINQPIKRAEITVTKVHNIPKANHLEPVITAFTNGLSNKVTAMPAELSLSDQISKVGEISLEPKNIVLGRLPNDDQLVLILDSGSSKTLISKTIATAHPDLARLKRVPIEELELYVGNDQTIKAKEMISIPLEIQNYKFHIPFIIVDQLTTRLSIIGDDTLSKIGTKLFLGTKKMQFDVKPVQLTAVCDYIIKPGETLKFDVDTKSNKNLEYGYNLPLKSSIIHLTNKSKEDSTEILFTNDSEIHFELKKGDVIACTDNDYIDINFALTDTQSDTSIINKDTIEFTDNIQKHGMFPYNEQFSEQSVKHVNEQQANSKITGDNWDAGDVGSLIPNGQDNITPHSNWHAGDSNASNFTAEQLGEQVDCKINTESQLTERPAEGQLTAEQQEIFNKLTPGQQARYLERVNRYTWLKSSDSVLYLSIDEIIDSKIKTENTKFDEKDIQELKEIIKENIQAFSIFGEIGRMRKFAHLNLLEHEHFAHRAYPCPPKHQAALQAEVNRLIKLGILEPSTEVLDISPAFPVIKKSSQSARLVIDLRKINQFTRLDAFPIVHFDLLMKLMSDEIGQFNDSQNYSAKDVQISVLDVTSAFNALRVDEESKKYLGVAIGEKTYVLNTIPMGYKSSSQIFSRHLEEILRKHPMYKKQIYSYIDDIILISSGKFQHKKLINELTKLLAEEGIKLSLDKCEFAAKKIVILGNLFTCTDQGVTIEPLRKRTEAIQQIAMPHDVKSLRSVLGSLNYLARFLPNFRKIAAPLYQLTSKKNKFEIKPEHIETFNKLKELVKHPKVIYLPRPDAKLRLVSDSCNTGFGSALFNVVTTESGDEELFPLGFASGAYGKKKFNSSVEHEMYAICNSVITFKYLLYSQPFEIITDSRSLVDLFNGKKSLAGKGKLLRLFEKISGFNFTIRHVKADSCHEIKLADALSRLKLIKETNPDLIRPISFPRYHDLMPLDDDEEVLICADDMDNLCHYNLRARVNKPDRYGIDNTGADEESDSEESTDKQDEEPAEDEEQEEESDEVSMKNSVEPAEFTGLDENSQIPEYMINPERQLFQSVNPQNVLIKHFPKQLDLNRFINDVLGCCRFYDNEPLTKEVLINAQKEHVLFRHIYRYLKLNVLPSNRNLCRQVLTMAEEYTLVDEMLCHVSFDKFTDKVKIRPVIPNSELAFRLINEYHASKLLNHTAITSTYKILNNKYYIKNLLSLITDFVKGCIPCNMNKDIPGQGKTFDFHLSMSKGERAMQCIYLDLKSMYTDPFNNNYLMVCVCSRTKFIMAEPIKDRSANLG